MPSPAKGRFKGRIEENCPGEPGSVPFPCLAAPGLGSSMEAGATVLGCGGGGQSPPEKRFSFDFLKGILPCGPFCKLGRKGKWKGKIRRGEGGEIKSKLSSPLEEEMCISFL